jgi:hypothetical protein
MVESILNILYILGVIFALIGIVLIAAFQSQGGRSIAKIEKANFGGGLLIATMASVISGLIILIYISSYWPTMIENVGLNQSMVEYALDETYDIKIDPDFEIPEFDHMHDQFMSDLMMIEIIMFSSLSILVILASMLVWKANILKALKASSLTLGFLLISFFVFNGFQKSDIVKNHLENAYDEVYDKFVKEQKETKINLDLISD